MARPSFWQLNGNRILVILAVLSVIGAAIFGTVSLKTDVEPYLIDVYPDADRFELLASDSAKGSFLYGVYDASDNQVAYISSGEGQGYGGLMITLVGWTMDGTIMTVNVPEHRDTPAWYSRLAAQDFFSQYIGQTYSSALSVGDDIDAASGATRSCHGVDVGVRSGRLLLSEQLGDPFPEPKEPIDFGINEIVLLLGLGMVVMFRTVPIFKGKTWARFLSLLYGFVVLGIWISAPLSLVNFAIWPAGFIPSISTNLFIYVLVLGVVGLALVFGKNFWCFWMCPFCAIQEGAHFIGGSRVRTLTKRQIALRNIRYFVLWAALMIALLMHSPAMTVFEPWNTIFSLTGNPEEWLLVIATVGIAVFIYDFWCHYLCPVGAVMDVVLKIRLAITDAFKRMAVKQ